MAIEIVDLPIKNSDFPQFFVKGRHMGSEEQIDPCPNIPEKANSSGSLWFPN